MASGRWTCPRCGSNNFDTVTACWKCGTPALPGAMAPQVAAPAAPPERYTPVVGVATPMVAVGGDAGMARRAALLLAITMPYFGLPVGWVFMMMEDHRRQAVGKLCVLWSLISLVAHFFMMIFALQSATALAVRFLVPMMQQMNSPSGGSPQMPRGLGGGLDRELNP